MIEIYEGSIFGEIFRTSLFKKVIDNLFEIRHKHKDENNHIMQLLVKLIMNSLYGEQIGKDTEESYHRKSENWMMTEYVERVVDYQKIKNGNFIVKMKKRRRIGG